MQKSKSIVLLIIFLAACSPASLTPVKPAITSTESPTTTPVITPSATEEPQPAYLLIDKVFPGSNPERFGERFFSGSFHSAPVFSPDGKTVWWGGEYSTATIYISQFESNSWSEPDIISFSESIHSYRDPFISPDGTRFYFISNETIPEIGEPGKENLWMMEKQDEDWSEPYPLPVSINSLSLHWTVSVADNYDLYFSAREGENTDIYISRYISEEYTDPEQLASPVNTEHLEITPNIAPDGSYLLFTRLTSTSDPPHLYISYAIDSGWSEPKRVENIPYCISPVVTPDRKFVIFLSSPSSFSWRDTSFVEALSPSE